MKLILSGDTHGTFDLDKIITFFQKQNTTYTKEDYLIICGDTGICGYSETEEAKVRHILRNLPVTTLFIDGNHEDFEKLNAFPVEKWHGGNVHFIEKDIIHLMRGQIFNLGGITFFTFGGAYSPDRRISGGGHFMVSGRTSLPAGILKRLGKFAKIRF